MIHRGRAQAHMKLMMLLFVATAAKNVDPHGVEASAAAKLGSPEVYKARVMPDEEKDSFESAFDGWSTFQLTRRGLSAMNRRVLKGEARMSILDSSTSCIVQVLSIVQLIKADAKQRRTSFESTFDGEAPPAPPLLTEAGKPLPPHGGWTMGIMLSMMMPTSKPRNRGWMWDGVRAALCLSCCACRAVLVLLCSSCCACVSCCACLVVLVVCLSCRVLSRRVVSCHVVFLVKPLCACMGRGPGSAPQTTVNLRTVCPCEVYDNSNPGGRYTRHPSSLRRTATLATTTLSCICCQPTAHTCGPRTPSPHTQPSPPPPPSSLEKAVPEP